MSKNRVRIIADSTCDLPEELIRKYDIGIVPLHITLGNVSCDDGVDVTPSEIYAWSKKNDAVPKTSSPSPGEIIEVFRKSENQYDQMICITISSDLSGSYQSFITAVQLSEMEDRIFVIDARNLSTGTGLLVLEAAEMAKEGKNALFIKEETEKRIPRIRTSFVIDSLSYLQKGGRCSSVEAFLGSAMRIHPVLRVEEGKIVSGKKLRGKMKRVYELYYESLKNEMLDADPKRVFLTHSGCDETSLELIRKKIEEDFRFKEIIVSQASCTVCSHCGPNTIGIFWMNAS